jgi:hypothetical protein
LITEREFVHLIDFGLARAAGEAGSTTAAARRARWRIWLRNGSRAGDGVSDQDDGGALEAAGEVFDSAPYG